MLFYLPRSAPRPGFRDGGVRWRDPPHIELEASAHLSVDKWITPFGQPHPGLQDPLEHGGGLPTKFLQITGHFDKQSDLIKSPVHCKSSSSQKK